MSLRSWLRSRTYAKSNVPVRRPRTRLAAELLEGRVVPATLAVSDASAVEGDAAVRYIDDFVSPNSGGLSNPHDVAFGADGSLYVASGLSDQVLRYDARTGAFTGAVVTGGASAVVIDNPWALAAGPDGKLYVAGAGSHNVVRYDPSTGAVDEFIPAGSGVRTPKGIAFGPDGHLYVSNADAGPADDSPLQDQVVRFEGPAGAMPGRLIDVFVPRGDNGLDNPNGLAFNGGSLYVASTRGDSVSRYDAVTGAFQGVFVPQSAGGLDVPAALAFHGGRLYVSSQGTAQVLRYDAGTGAFVDAVATAGSPGADGTAGLDFDAYGNLYVGFRDGTSATPSPGDACQVLRYGAASQAAFRVTLSEASATEVNVDFRTVDATAAGGLDYLMQSQYTLTFAPGVTSRTVLVPILDDASAEPGESFTLQLINPTGAVIADGEGVGTIHDDEPRISIGDVTKAEGKKGQTTKFIFTVTLSAAYDQVVTMSFRTLDGTAKASNGDYVARTGTLTFAPGETTKTIIIDVKGDSTKEANEAFSLELFALSANAIFLDSLGLGTILNDD